MKSIILFIVGVVDVFIATSTLLLGSHYDVTMITIISLLFSIGLFSIVSSAVLMSK